MDKTMAILESLGDVCKYRPQVLIVQAVKLDKSIKIETSQGSMIACRGNYVVRSAHGCLSVMSAEEFKREYELV